MVFKADIQDPEGKLLSWNEDDDSPCIWNGTNSRRSSRYGYRRWWVDDDDEPGSSDTGRDPFRFPTLRVGGNRRFFNSSLYYQISSELRRSDSIVIRSTQIYTDLDINCFGFRRMDQSCPGCFPKARMVRIETLADMLKKIETYQRSKSWSRNQSSNERS